MTKKKLLKPFSEEKQQHYERVARLQYGPENVNESIKRWNGYTQAEKDAIFEEGSGVYLDMANAMEAGMPTQSAEVQAIVQRWHDHLRHFYEPTLEILAGLGEMYSSNPEFRAFFEKVRVNLADYFSEAVGQYVDALETAEIERLIAEDEAKKADGQAMSRRRSRLS